MQLYHPYMMKNPAKGKLSMMKQKGLSIEKWKFKSLTEDVNTYYDRVENESIMSLLIKTNAIRKSISSKQELIKNLYLTIKKLEKEKKTK